MAAHPVAAAGRALIGLLAALATFVAAPAARAHPHAWIDLHSRVVFASTGLITAIEEEWWFDELYTGFVVEDLSEGKPVTPEVVDRFGAKVLENLAPYDYFTVARAGKQPQKFGPVTQFKSRMDQQRLRLTFTVPLATPVDPKAAPFTLSIYDPTYFIEMRHPDAQAASLANAPAGCATRIERAKPSQSTIAKAFSMDRGAAPDDTLGQLFAETVALACK